MALSKAIFSGNVIRWFFIDWDYFGGPKAGIVYHDDVMDALGSMNKAVEVNSGHTGFNVAFENTKRKDSAIVAAIHKALKRWEANHEAASKP